jgi:ferredoxin
MPGQCYQTRPEPGLEHWLKLNREYSAKWPNLTAKELPPADAKEWDGVPDKLAQFSPNPHEEQSGFDASPLRISKNSAVTGVL